MPRTEAEKKNVIERAIRLHDDGLNVPAISQLIGVPKSTVRYWVDMRGLSSLLYQTAHRSDDEQEHEIKEKAARIPFYQKMVEQRQPIQWSTT